VNAPTRVGGAVYGRGMPRRHPNPKKDKSARRRRPAAAPALFTAGLLDPATAARATQVQRADAPPEAVIPVLTTVLWTGIMQGEPANVCVDGCRTIAYALAQFGIATELRAVDLAIRDQRSGRGLFRTRPQPHWDGATLVGGHCILTLPDHGRYIDPTIEQYPEVATLGLGPIVGRCGAQLDPNTGQVISADGPPGRLAAGTPMAVQREHLLLMYMVSDDDITHLITDSPWVSHTRDAHFRAGVNLASLVISGLSGHMRTQAAQAAYPRLHALLDVLDGVPISEPAADRDVWFNLPGPHGNTQPLRLDELTLPPGSPPSAPVT